MDTLNAVISLLDASMLPEEVTDSLRKEHAGTLLRWNNRLYVLMNEHILSTEDTLEGRTVLETMAGGATQGKKKSETHSLADSWRNCLLYADPAAIRELTEEYRERNFAKRCVVIFQSRQDGEDLRIAMLAELAPKEEKEPLIAISGSEIALIRDTENQTADDLTEYVQAVVEFAESEMGISLMAGIGGARASLEEVSESYQEAARALKIGKQFHLTESVHVYQKQILERLLAAVPEKERTQCRKQVFNERTQKLLNDEMRETIRVFFENDLNLSTTARQLFLHRNTLTYRLDRIRKETGLDLRSFKDAAAFKAIMECPGEEGSGMMKGGM